MLESTKCTSLVRIKRGGVCQKTFRLLRPVTAGKGDFFLLCKLNCQFAVDPVFDVEKGIIQHGLSRLRVTVNFSHERLNLTEFRRIGFRAGISFTNPAGSRTAEINQFFIVSAADCDGCRLLAHHHFIFQKIKDRAIQLFRHGVATIFIHTDLQSFAFKFAQPVIFTLTHKANESGFMLACGFALRTTSWTFNLLQFLFQRGFKLIQFRQLAV